jgi:CRISPR/Cas system-associated exonuclease Cas4 (RecB family)
MNKHISFTVKIKTGARIHLIYVEDDLRKHVYNTNNKILEIVSRNSTRQPNLLQNGITIMFIKC